METNSNEPCGSGVNNDVEAYALFLTRSNLNFIDFPILSGTVLGIILETHPPRMPQAIVCDIDFDSKQEFSFFVGEILSFIR